MDLASRRNALKRAGLLTGTITLGLPGDPGAAQRESPGWRESSQRAKVVVAGGHPGDPEYGCGGTIARYTDLGHEVVIVYLNRGELGVRGEAPERAGAIRFAEAAKACQILKARPLYSGQVDGRTVVDEAHYEEFHQLLAAQRPDVVFTQWPIDNHSDHTVVSLLVYQAWQRMNKRFALYYYEVSNGSDTVHFSPTHYIDITGTAARKRAACYAHASQAPDKYYSLQEQVTRFRGIESGYQQAEGYVRHVQSPDFQLPLG